MRWLFALFVIVPLAELAALIWLGGHVGIPQTIAMIVVSGFVGAWLARREGLKVWQSFRDALAGMRPPERGVIDGLLVLVGATLLIAPGVVTDALGLLLLVPVTRAWFAERVRRVVDQRLLVVQRGAEDMSWRYGGVVNPEARGDVVVTVGEDADEPEARPVLPPRREQ